MQGPQLYCPIGYEACCYKPRPVPDVIICGVRKVAQTAPPETIGQASFGAYPWVAALMTPAKAFKGSGVLLDETHVLTAAHKVAAFA